MSIPLPKKPLGTHCSALNNNTLYTFSEDAFQSLELKNGSKWKTLPLNVGTKGAACVLAGRGTPDESLYIVGGSTTNTQDVPANGFMGLQKWTFSTRTWENISLPQAVTFNLTGHGASYIESTGRIIVFAGTQYPTVDVASANTFLIQAAAPYEVISMPAQKALLAPIVLPWGTDGALIVGGDTTNTALSTYTTTAGWGGLDLSLTKGLPARGSAWASLMGGDDGSRVLMTFDLTTSPATVETKRVKDATTTKNKRATAASPAVSTESQLTESNWPAYNGTGAPKDKRSGTAMAYDGDMVVISGGNDEEPLLLFDARKNEWVSAQSVLNPSSHSFSVLSTSGSASSATAMQTAPASSSTASDPAVVGASSKGSGHHLNTLQTLFVVLGSILGACFILGCAYFFLRKRRIASDRQRNQLNGDGGGRDRMSFQDRGASFMKEAGGSINSISPLGYRRDQNDSWLNVQRQASKRNPVSKSYNDTNFQTGPQIHRINGQGVVVHPGQSTSVTAPGDRGLSGEIYGKEARGSGWSRYFSDSSATNLVVSPPRAYSGAHSSVYTDLSTSQGERAPNPYLYNAGPGVAAGGGSIMGVPSIQRAGSNGILLAEPRRYEPHERRDSNITLSSIGGDSYSSGIPESLTEKPLWSTLDTEREREQDYRQAIPSSVYPSSNGGDTHRQTEFSMYSSNNSNNNNNNNNNEHGSQHEGVDNLSWLNLRHD
ncbi:hypothetical protein FN846DRAFT_630910 [Sphaerosporella brunnea]|uniref:Galactose oxidase n=1 Tax=Sphaerosporella brunnea TaxID=1250544 RepID=A0A5J5F0Q0_9PEZI|nr:hypothetical protein FN846DRAFT_630910 [Sphaerosporella brunnea]